MAESIKKLAQLTLDGTVQTIYTAPTSTSTIIKEISLVNFTLSNVNATIWDGGNADNNIILPPTSIDAGGHGEFNGVYFLEAGDVLKAQASASASITMTVYGVELS